MTGVALQYDLSGIDGLNRRIAKLSRVERDELLDTIGAVVASQTRRRIESEKSAPDGTPWPAWSDRYAATRHSGQSLLMGEGDLADSIDHQVSGDDVDVGSNLIYAAIHQFGSDDDPVQVPAHQRRITQAFGKTLPFPVVVDVAAYSFQQNIPAREYLGLSADNESDLETEIDRFFEGVLR